MAATKVDELFEQVSSLIKEIQLVFYDTEDGLDLAEAAQLSEISEKIVALWDEYMDRMISEAAANVRNPEELVFQADADMDEMDRARERVRMRLIERGVPLGGIKKNLLN